MAPRGPAVPRANSPLARKARQWHMARMTKNFASQGSQGSQGKENSDGCWPWVCAPCYGEPGQEPRPESDRRRHTTTFLTHTRPRSRLFSAFPALGPDSAHSKYKDHQPLPRIRAWGGKRITLHTSSARHRVGYLMKSLVRSLPLHNKTLCRITQLR
jgi:hypothetical protein